MNNNNLKNMKLNPNWVIGFTDAEGCFRISIIKNKNSKGKALPLSVRLYFQIGLHRKDEAILKSRKLSSLNKTRSFSTYRDNSNKLNPAVVYTNADIQKMQIIQENKGRCGIYRWINLLNGKNYVGSGTNLYKRLTSYYSIRYLERELQKKNSLIYKALVKYGYLNFTLEIIEYCEPKDVIKREQYYIDLLKPEYNICKTAGSTLGFQYTEESKAKMAAAKKGNKNCLGKIHTEETKKKMREAQKDKCKTLEVFDLETNETTSYNSIREAAKALSCAPSAIKYSLKNPEARAYRGRYKFSQTPVSN